MEPEEEGGESGISAADRLKVDLAEWGDVRVVVLKDMYISGTVPRLRLGYTTTHRNFPYRDHQNGHPHTPLQQKP